MKLIKADDLAEKLEISENCDGCKYVKGVFCDWKPNAVDICEAIYDAPEVEAIPIQWIIDNYITDKPADESVPYMVMVNKWREEKNGEGDCC